MSTQTRYLTVTRTRTPRQALERKQREAVCLRARIEELEAELEAVRSAPLSLKWQEQVPVKPGEPGYEEADTCFNPALYHGDWTWANTAATAEEKP